MCWTTCEIPSELTAETDIPILKIGEELGNIMVSPYNKFPYKLGKIYKIPKIIPIYCNDQWHIHEGFHSYDPKEIRIYCVPWDIIVAKGVFIQGRYPERMNVFDGFIPKGSHYYLNMYGELVSDGICITNKKIE